MLEQWTDVDEIVVGCPGGFATGGTELLHQLVHTLRGLGKNAWIFYYERPEAGRPAVFDCYDTPVRAPGTAQNSLFVVPETGVHVLRRFPATRKCIWWLSVDNYAAFYGDEQTLGVWRRFKRFRKGCSPYAWARDPALVHLVQSQYAADFIQAAGLSAHRLGDYLRDDFLEIDISTLPPKQDQVCFNPKKGLSFTRQLMAQPVPWRWVALENMSPAGMRETLLASRVYIDFGHHPGKDRIPREAAMAGCVVITGRDGSAANSVDVPIPERFKIDQGQADAVVRALAAIGQVIGHYDASLALQDSYRRRTAMEKAEFLEDVRALFV